MDKLVSMVYKLTIILELMHKFKQTLFLMIHIVHVYVSPINQLLQIKKLFVINFTQMEKDVYYISMLILKIQEL